MSVQSTTAAAACRQQAIAILGGESGEIEIDGKKQKLRVTKAGKIVGDGKRNKHLSFSPSDLLPVGDSQEGEKLAFQPVSGDGVDATYGHGVAAE
jgi:hypothetical protein